MVGNRKGLMGLTLNSLPDNAWLSQPAPNMGMTPMGGIIPPSSEMPSVNLGGAPIMNSAPSAPVGSLSATPQPIAESIADFKATPNATATPAPQDSSLLGSLGTGDMINMAMMGAKFAAGGMGPKQSQDIAPPAPVAPPMNTPSSAQSAELLKSLAGSRIGAIGGAAGGLGGLGGVRGDAGSLNDWKKQFSSLRG